MTQALHVASDFALPLEAVTQTFVILAKRGVGKTYTASVVAEEMLKAGQPIVAIDPTGAWWGLRSEFPVAVLGGEHGDVALDEHAGEVVAQSVVENRFPAVVDLSLFRKGQMQRFMVAFLETLYRLNREALHLFIDEADAFAPQQHRGGGVEEARLLGAMEDIVRRGRKRGVGCTLITQRPAVINKNVLTQCEVLVCLRLVHPKDIAAVEEWVNVHADPAQAKEMIDSLPSLPVGTAWFWSPGWGDFFQRVKVRRRETFDSGATPKPGEAAREPKHLQKIDIDALGERIKATVEKQKAEDPRELKRQVAELRKQLAERPAPEKTVETVEVPVIPADQLDTLRELSRGLYAAADRVAEATKDALRIANAPAAVAPLDHAHRVKPTAVPVQKVKQPNALLSGDLTGPQQAILDTVLMLEARGIAPDRRAVARWLNVHPDTGSHKSNVARLRSEGYLDGFTLTDRGRSAARPRPTGLDAALAALPVEPMRRMLRAIADAGRDLSRHELAELLGVHPDTGSHKKNLGRLRTMGLVTERGRIAITAGALA